jgi:hypothetical protein
MFHFPGFPPPALYIQAGVTPHHGCRVPPFGHPRINARLTAPRGLSRPPTSFIGSWYQGIHHAPLHTYTPDKHVQAKHQGTTTETKNHHLDKLDARIHYPVLKHPTNTPHPPRHHTQPTHDQPENPNTTRDPGTNPRTRRPAVCLQARTRDRRNNQPPPHPPHPAHSGRTRGRRRGGRACSLRTQQCAIHPPPHHHGPGTNRSPSGDRGWARLRCFHP